MDKALQERIRGYIDHLAEEERAKKEYREQFLALIPEAFKKEVLMNLNGHFLTENPIFRFNFDHRLLKEAAALLEESTFCPDEYLYRVRKILLV